MILSWVKRCLLFFCRDRWWHFVVWYLCAWFQVSGRSVVLWGLDIGKVWLILEWLSQVVFYTRWRPRVLGPGSRLLLLLRCQVVWWRCTVLRVPLRFWSICWPFWIWLDVMIGTWFEHFNDAALRVVEIDCFEDFWVFPASYFPFAGVDAAFAVCGEFYLGMTLMLFS